MFHHINILQPFQYSWMWNSFHFHHLIESFHLYSSFIFGFAYTPIVQCLHLCVIYKFSLVTQLIHMYCLTYKTHIFLVHVTGYSIGLLLFGILNSDLPMVIAFTNRIIFYCFGVKPPHLFPKLYLYRFVSWYRIYPLCLSLPDFVIPLYNNLGNLLTKKLHLMLTFLVCCRNTITKRSLVFIPWRLCPTRN